MEVDRGGNLAVLDLLITYLVTMERKATILEVDRIKSGLEKIGIEITEELYDYLYKWQAKEKKDIHKKRAERLMLIDDVEFIKNIKEKKMKRG